MSLKKNLFVCLHWFFICLNVQFNIFRCFFDVCDGIFLNYTWTKKHLKRSVQVAGARCLDVYVGVDVFGRNCYGGGGFDSDKVKGKQHFFWLFCKEEIFKRHPYFRLYL